MRVDDCVGAFEVHCAAGVWGLLVVGLFHESEGVAFGGGGKLLGAQHGLAKTATGVAAAGSGAAGLPDPEAPRIHTTPDCRSRL